MNARDESLQRRQEGGLQGPMATRSAGPGWILEMWLRQAAQYCWCCRAFNVALNTTGAYLGLTENGGRVWLVSPAQQGTLWFDSSDEAADYLGSLAEPDPPEPAKPSSNGHAPAPKVPLTRAVQRCGERMFFLEEWPWPPGQSYWTIRTEGKYYRGEREDENPFLASKACEAARFPSVEVAREALDAWLWQIIQGRKLDRLRKLLDNLESGRLDVAIEDVAGKVVVTFSWRQEAAR